MSDTDTPQPAPTAQAGHAAAPAARQEAAERPAGTVRLILAPDRTPQEEADLVARVAAAVAEDAGDRTVNLQLIESEHVTITGSVADRLQTTSRWSA